MKTTEIKAWMNVSCKLKLWSTRSNMHILRQGRIQSAGIENLSDTKARQT